MGREIYLCYNTMGEAKIAGREKLCAMTDNFDKKWIDEQN